TDSSSQQRTSSITISASGLPFAKPGGSAQLQLNGCFNAFHGNIGGTGCTWECTNLCANASGPVSIDGASVGAVGAYACNCACTPFTNNTLTIPNFQQYVAADAAITLSMTTNSNNVGCSGLGVLISNFSYSLSYETQGTGTITSVPISLDAFAAGKNWDGLSF